ncbi:hypothetical protein Pmani_022636 [Petrolisthes manimaculis]|uniref:BHLH domain-containing protein n=1 Tax=Petrolisthes manimaculis TaxID=1843537 RepID=A0AAE1PBD9_9EUCA|nr:hypothetical protein Pmani_022636 [Petrolisthes manimaculis]
MGRRTEKYCLRPRVGVRRLQQDRYRENTVIKREESNKCPKSRPPPLSKYRRKTANARERHRMKEINDAFETLRRILPDFCTGQTPPQTPSTATPIASPATPTTNLPATAIATTTAAAAVTATSHTKINTLRLAVSYIRSLSHLLQEEEEEEEEEGPSISLLDDLHLGQVTPHVRSQESGPETIAGSEIDQYTTGYLATPSTTSIKGTPGRPFITPSSPLAFSSFLDSGSGSSGSGGSGSGGGGSDLSEFPSDDSCCVFEDNNYDFFDDIPVLSEVDPIALLLTTESESQVSV